LTTNYDEGTWVTRSKDAHTRRSHLDFHKAHFQISVLKLDVLRHFLIVASALVTFARIGDKRSRDGRWWLHLADDALERSRAIQKRAIATGPIRRDDTPQLQVG
jgi:hypothetical protein